MYNIPQYYTVGYHGCDSSVKKKVLQGNEHLLTSTNDYDWLGHGIYFWENDYHRALSYAEHIKKHPRRSKGEIKNPDVIGAVINLGECLNLLQNENLKLVQEAYHSFKTLVELQGGVLPTNKKIEKENDILIRKLDCAVINYLHVMIKKQNRKTFDTIKSAFWEGNALYPNAGFKDKNHIQICVINPKCIIGYFHPLHQAYL